VRYQPQARYWVVKGQDRVEIVVARARDEPAITKEVPRRWYNFEQKARRVKNNLARNLRDNDNVRGIGVGSVDEHIEGKRKASVDVVMEPNRESDVDLPSHADGVPINREIGVTDPEGFTCNRGDFNQAQGGVGFAQQHGDTGDQTDGTLGWKVEVENPTNNSTSREPGMLTASHTLPHSGSCPDEYNGPAHQGYDYIGDVTIDNRFADVAVIQGENSQYLGEVEFESPGYMSGIITEDGLSDFKSDGEWIKKGGITTCTTWGQVEKVGFRYSNNCVQYTDYVKVSANADRGDSGGPIYYNVVNPDGDESDYCIGIIYGGSESQPVGPAAYKIKDHYDMIFATNYK